MAEPRFVPDAKLVDLLKGLPGGRKVVNVSSDETQVWADLGESDPSQVAAGLRGPRPFNSFKGALMPATELVARYGKAEGDPLEEISDLTVAVIGVRGCECRAITYLDRIMLDEPMADPFYRTRRDNAFIVGVDCAVPADTCFCNLLAEAAYPEVNYDLDLSPIDDGFLVKAGSENGREALEGRGSLLAEPTAGQLEQRKRMRLSAAERLTEQNAEYEFPEDFASGLPQTLEQLFWRAELGNCVQCGGCTAVCPQCYCFLLYDQRTDGDAYERGRLWDSCQFTGYSQMAAPAGLAKPDPRREHMSKFQHRFAHKFWYNPLTLGILGCVGCGRCAATCPGKIDLRRVLSNVNKACAEHG